MEKLKCTECGQVFNKSLNTCPKCGHPANECTIVAVGDDEKVYVKEEKTITQAKTFKDTGYKHEKVIKEHATAVFIILIIMGILHGVVCVVIAVNQEREAELIWFGVGAIGFSSIVLAASVIRAFLMVYANISINLHDINQKIK